LDEKWTGMEKTRMTTQNRQKSNGKKKKRFDCVFIAMNETIEITFIPFKELINQHFFGYFCVSVSG